MTHIANRLLSVVIALLLIIPVLGGCTSDINPPQTENGGIQGENDRDIVILHTNDMHTYFTDNIGISGVVALKEEMESEGNYVALVDAGDAIQGTGIGAVSQGEIPVKLMNEAGYSVAIPGNHEFDFTTERFLELVKEASYPYLSCNVNDPRTGELYFAPYTVMEFGCYRVAFVGVTTPTTMTGGLATRYQNESGETIVDFMQKLPVEEFYSAIQNAVDSARAEGADFVIALSHLGISASDSPYTSSEMIENTSGIDAVIDGHSHSEINCERVRNRNGEHVLLTQTGTQLHNVGMLVISKSGNVSTGLIRDYRSRSERMDAVLNELLSEYDAMSSEIVAHTNYDLVINEPGTDPAVRIVRNAETNLADLIADSFRSYYHADIGVQNAGGIRTSIPSGDITYKNLINVLPFNNTMCCIEATGQQILDLLELGATDVPAENGSFIHVSGLTYEIDVTVPKSVVFDENGSFVSVDGEYRVKNVTVSGEPLDLTKLYTVAGTNYVLTEGGGGRTMFRDCTLLAESGDTDLEAFQIYLTDTLGGEVPEAYADPHGEERIIAIQ